MKPLTNEQIWGIPEEEQPVEVPKDYFNYEDKKAIDQCSPQAAGQGEEADCQDISVPALCGVPVVR